MSLIPQLQLPLFDESNKRNESICMWNADLLPRQPIYPSACPIKQWINVKLFMHASIINTLWVCVCVCVLLYRTVPYCTDFTSSLCRCHHKIPQKCAHRIAHKMPPTNNHNDYYVFTDERMGNQKGDVYVCVFFLYGIALTCILL